MGNPDLGELLKRARELTRPPWYFYLIPILAYGLVITMLVTLIALGWKFILN